MIWAASEGCGGRPATGQGLSREVASGLMDA